MKTRQTGSPGSWTGGHVRSPPRFLLLPVSVGALVAACATTPRPPSPTPESERTILELRASNAGYLRRMEELENRIFILEDQLDSRKLAAEQREPATLPASARPSPVESTVPETAASSSGAAQISSPAPDDGSGLVETTIVAEHAVDYAGDAVQKGGDRRSTRRGSSRRPVLRLSATKTDASGLSHTPEPLPGSRHVVLGTTTIRPLKLYREALRTLQGGRPELAMGGFRRFLAENPEHDYADNAQYWIGECHYDQRQFRAAERAFRRVVEQYPHGNKVPDAMLKLGFTLQALADDQAGRAVLESLARAFPKHEAARLAAARLAHPEPEPPEPVGTVLPVTPVLTSPAGTGVAPALMTPSREARR